MHTISNFLKLLMFHVSIVFNARIVHNKKKDETRLQNYETARQKGLRYLFINTSSVSVNVYTNWLLIKNTSY